MTHLDLTRIARAITDSPHMLRVSIEPGPPCVMIDGRTRSRRRGSNEHAAKPHYELRTLLTEQELSGSMEPTGQILREMGKINEGLNDALRREASGPEGVNAHG